MPGFCLEKGKSNLFHIKVLCWVEICTLIIALGKICVNSNRFFKLTKCSQAFIMEIEENKNFGLHVQCRVRGVEYG